MSDIINSAQNFQLSIKNDADLEKISNIGSALSSIDKLKILQLLSVKPMTLSELSRALDLAVSTVSFHIDSLVKAQLIFISYEPGIKGHVKLCTKATHNLFIDFDMVTSSNSKIMNSREVIEMPIGNFVDCDVQSPCGIAGKTKQLIENDSPQAFFSPNRSQAELIWFQSGYISYLFPTHFFKSNINYKQISFSFELCSETVYFRNDWPSDITIWINDIEIATYTSPGDFGGRRGKYTPEYWFINSTQYGLLRRFTVTNAGVFIDNQLVNRRITFDDLKLKETNRIKLTIGIKEDAAHKGGINIFGKNFGDYPQSIIMTISD